MPLDDSPVGEEDIWTSVDGEEAQEHGNSTKYLNSSHHIKHDISRIVGLLSEENSESLDRNQPE